MPQPDELTIYIEGRNTVAKSHLAETLQDIFLTLGYQVAPDPNHGYFTPAGHRVGPKDMPPICIVEYDEAVEQEIEVASAVQ